MWPIGPAMVNAPLFVSRIGSHDARGGKGGADAFPSCNNPSLNPKLQHWIQFIYCDGSGSATNFWTPSTNTSIQTCAVHGKCKWDTKKRQLSNRTCVMSAIRLIAKFKYGYLVRVSSFGHEWRSNVRRPRWGITFIAYVSSLGVPGEMRIGDFLCTQTDFKHEKKNSIAIWRLT